MEYLDDEYDSNKENCETNNIKKSDLDYIDNIYDTKNLDITEEEELNQTKRSHEAVFFAWINELVSPELLDYREAEIKSLCHSIKKEKERQIITRNERNYYDMIEKVEVDLRNLHIYRSSFVLRMYLRQRILKISEYPDFSIANSRLEGSNNDIRSQENEYNTNEVNDDFFVNLSEEEATFALKLSKLQWRHLDDTVSKMKNTLASDNNVPIPSPSFHRVVRFQCNDSVGNARLALGPLETNTPTQFEEYMYNNNPDNTVRGIDYLFGGSSNSQNETEQIVNIEKGKIYTSKYEDIRNLLFEGHVQLWPWPPITSNRK